MKELLKKAADAALNAYCPHSGFRVGAALLSVDGTVFVGCNIENASYGLTLCAERSALSAAISAGTRDFSAVAIVAMPTEESNISETQTPYPCGACRQVLSEFCNPDLKIFVASANALDSYEECTLGELLPKAFTIPAKTNGTRADS
jgi:cytidine deaminase